MALSGPYLGFVSPPRLQGPGFFCLVYSSGFLGQPRQSSNNDALPPALQVFMVHLQLLGMASETSCPSVPMMSSEVSSVPSRPASVLLGLSSPSSPVAFPVSVPAPLCSPPVRCPLPAPTASSFPAAVGWLLVICVVNRSFPRTESCPFPEESRGRELSLHRDQRGSICPKVLSIRVPRALGTVANGRAIPLDGQPPLGSDQPLPCRNVGQ